MNDLLDNKPKVLFILGPTASGKTAGALALAQRNNIEIISVDSALVYQDMNIGTAKPTLAERSVCPHHLIDIIAPTDVYSAADFAHDALQLIDAILKRGRVPVLVGGTMLYVRALLNGLTPLPDAQPEIRARIEKQAIDIGWGALYQQLERIDPKAASVIKPNDTQRIERALEVFYATGKPLSEHWQSQPNQMQQSLPFLPVIDAFVPEQRSWLHDRINQRFKDMLASGFLDEVMSLRHKYALEENMPSMRCVGYRQAWQYLAGAISKDLLIEQGQAATRQLAKRQMTWLRGMDDVRIWDCSRLASQNDWLAQLDRDLG